MIIRLMGVKEDNNHVFEIVFHVLHQSDSWFDVEVKARYKHRGLVTVQFLGTVLPMHLCI